MLDLTQVALWHCSALPDGIRSRVLEDDDFRKSNSLRDKVLTLRDGGVLWLDEALEAARRCYANRSEIVVRMLNGDEVRTRFQDQAVRLVRTGKEDGEGIVYQPFQLVLVSPNRGRRIAEFRALYNQFGVTGPRCSQWVPILEDRPLDNTEVVRIHDAVMRSVPNWWAITQDKVLRGHVTAEELVPELSGYFESLCGPLPAHMHVDEYIQGPLAGFRESLVFENLQDGLSITLLGNLRSDLSITSALSQFSTGELWESVQRLRGVPDPFSILGLFEISVLLGGSDERFREIAVDLLGRLCSDSLIGTNGLDVYELLPILVELSLRRLRRTDGLGNQPNYWHWYCAFVHAGFLVRSLGQLEFDLGEMTEWIKERRTIRDGLADILAVQDEPTWRFDHLSSERIRAQIVGRIRKIEETLVSKGESFPDRSLVAECVDRLLKRGKSPFRPGPLEGNLRPKNNGKEKQISSEELAIFQRILVDSPLEFPWAAWDELSGSVYFPKEFLRVVADALPTIELPGNNFAERSNALATAGFVAVVHSDGALANGVAERVFRELKCEANSEMAFIVLLLASMSLGGDDWVEWFEDKLCRFAMMLDADDQRQVLVYLVAELKRILPMRQWRFSRVEALCRM